MRMEKKGGKQGGGRGEEGLQGEIKGDKEKLIMDGKGGNYWMVGK